MPADDCEGLKKEGERGPGRIVFRRGEECTDLVKRRGGRGTLRLKSRRER